MCRGSASTFLPRLVPSWGFDREVWGKREREGRRGWQKGRRIGWGGSGYSDEGRRVGVCQRQVREGYSRGEQKLLLPKIVDDGNISNPLRG